MTIGLLAAAAGCGGGSDVSDGDQFTYWSLWQKSEPQAKVLKKAIKGFEKDTGIQVDVQWQGRDVTTKLVAALNTGDVPDLVDGGADALHGALVVHKQTADVSDVYAMSIPGEKHSVDEVIPDKYDRFTSTDDGTPFMVPYEVLAYGIWFNGNDLPAVAKDPPKTWQEFTSLLADLKAEGHHPLAVDGDIGSYNAFWTTTALIRTLGAGGFYELATAENPSGWDGPKVRKALDNIATLVDKGYFLPGYAASKFPAIQKKWAAGKSDFYLNGSWLPSETAPYAKKNFEYRALNFPAMGGGSTVSVTPLGFAIPKPAEHADAAKKFIAYFMNAERLSGISKVAKNLTPRTDIKAPEPLADLQRILGEHEFNKIQDGVGTDYPTYMTQVFEPINNKLLTGKLTPDEFVTKIKAKQKQYWRQHG